MLAAVHESRAYFLPKGPDKVTGRGFFSGAVEPLGSKARAGASQMGQTNDAPGHHPLIK